MQLESQEKDLLSIREESDAIRAESMELRETLKSERSEVNINTSIYIYIYRG